MARGGIEKIKTIGAAYMAVCGLPVKNENHCVNVVNAVMEMMRVLEERNRSHEIKWQIRIGIHTGQVIGSVIGTKKYIYDVFGDTVNAASRLQTCSKPMKINVSGEVVNKIKGNYHIASRGEMPIMERKKWKCFSSSHFSKCNKLKTHIASAICNGGYLDIQNL